MSQAQTALVLPEPYLSTSIAQAETDISHKIDTADSLYELTNVGIFHLLAYLKYNEKASMTFSIPADLKPHYILIKGLIVFCRSKGLVVNFNLLEKTITIDLSLSDIVLLKKLLGEVSTRLHDELKFKMKLKRILEFEKRYKEEARIIYTS